MESIGYPSWISSNRERLDKLKCTASAFFTDPIARCEFHILALVVNVGQFSKLLTSLPRGKIEKKRRFKIVQKENGFSDFQLKRSRKLKQIAAQQFSIDCESLLCQALKDAKVLTLWLNQTFFSNTSKQRNEHKDCCRSSALVSMTVEVVVMVFLEPETVSDLALFISWQKGLEAQRYSPLRHAAFLCVSFGSPLFRQNWISYFGSCQSERGTSKTQIAVSVLNLSALVLPHQTLLIDVGWCLEVIIDAKHTQNRAEEVIPPRKRTKQSFKSDSTSISLDMSLDIFFEAICSYIQIPIGGKVAFSLPYSHLVSKYHTQVCHKCHSSMITIESTHRQKCERCTASTETVCNFFLAFTDLSSHVRSLLHRLQKHFTQLESWKIITSYEVTLNDSLVNENCGTLVKEKNYAESKLNNGVELKAISFSSFKGKIRETIHGAGNSTLPATPTLVSLPLVHGLQDVYALLGLLMQHDPVELYLWGVSFSQGARRRLYAASAFGVVRELGQITARVCVGRGVRGRALARSRMQAIEDASDRKGVDHQDFIGREAGGAGKAHVTGTGTPHSLLHREAPIRRGNARSHGLRLALQAQLRGKRGRRGSTNAGSDN